MDTTTFAKTVGLTKYTKPMIIESRKPSWEWGKIFKAGTMEAGTWQTYQYTGFGAAHETDELEAVQFDEAYELDPIVLTAVKYTKGFMVSEEMEEDNQQIPALLTNWARSIGRVQRYAREVCMASIFNNSFDSSYDGWDGVELCGSHTTNSGTTIDNDLGPTSLAWDTLWDQLKYFDYQIYDEAGLPITGTAKYLVTHPVNRDTVEAILESPGKYDTADRHANTLAGSVTPIYCRLLSSQTAYWIVGEEQMDHLHFLVKKEITSRWKDAFENIGRKNRTHQRFAYGFSDYRFIVGNPGA